MHDTNDNPYTKMSVSQLRAELRRRDRIAAWGLFVDACVVCLAGYAVYWLVTKGITKFV